MGYLGTLFESEDCDPLIEQLLMHLNASIITLHTKSWAYNFPDIKGKKMGFTMKYETIFIFETSWLNVSSE